MCGTQILTRTRTRCNQWRDRGPRLYPYSFVSRLTNLVAQRKTEYGADQHQRCVHESSGTSRKRLRNSQRTSFCGPRRRNQSVIKNMTHTEYPRVIGTKFHGREALCCTKTLSSYRQHKSTSFQIRCFVSEAELQKIHNLSSLGRTELNVLHKRLSIVGWSILTESRCVRVEDFLPRKSKTCQRKITFSLQARRR